MCCVLVCLRDFGALLKLTVIRSSIHIVVILSLFVFNATRRLTYTASILYQSKRSILLLDRLVILKSDYCSMFAIMLIFMLCLMLKWNSKFQLFLHVFLFFISFSPLEMPFQIFVTVPLLSFFFLFISNSQTTHSLRCSELFSAFFL